MSTADIMGWRSAESTYLPAYAKRMVQLVTVFTIWTAAIAVLMSVFALADNKWPDEINKVTFGKRAIAVALYVFTIVAGSVTMWEAWKTVGFGGASMGGY